MPKPIKSKLLLPRPLSWSGMFLFESNPTLWEKKYLDGEDVMFSNAGLRFGKKMAEHIEGDEETEDIELSAIKSRLKLLQKRNMPLSCVLNSIHGAIPLFGVLDTAESNLEAFRDQKTGVTGWTQRKADGYGQLHFYATMIYLIKGKITKAGIYWIKTVNENGEISATGEIESFEVTITMPRILEMMFRITKNAVAIDKITREHIKNL